MEGGSGAESPAGWGAGGSRHRVQSSPVAERSPFENNPSLFTVMLQLWEGRPAPHLPAPGPADAPWRTGSLSPPLAFTGFILASTPASLLTDYFILTLWFSCLVGGIFLSIVFIKSPVQKQGPELLF